MLFQALQQLFALCFLAFFELSERGPLALLKAIHDFTKTLLGIFHRPFEVEQFIPATGFNAEDPAHEAGSSQLAFELVDLGRFVCKFVVLRQLCFFAQDFGLMALRQRHPLILMDVMQVIEGNRDAFLKSLTLLNLIVSAFFSYRSRRSFWLLQFPFERFSLARLKDCLRRWESGKIEVFQFGLKFLCPHAG